jgi:hypothetical protein
MKKTYITILVLLTFASIVYIDISNRPTVEAPVVSVSSAKNATYILDGNSVTLKDGISEVEAAPGSASKITTRYFGNEVVHDFNGDGRDAEILVEEGVRVKGDEDIATGVAFY